jgi:hypothetical protein
MEDMKKANDTTSIVPTGSSAGIMDRSLRRPAEKHERIEDVRLAQQVVKKAKKLMDLYEKRLVPQNFIRSKSDDSHFFFRIWEELPGEHEILLSLDKHLNHLSFSITIVWMPPESFGARVMLEDTVLGSSMKGIPAVKPISEYFGEWMDAFITKADKIIGEATAGRRIFKRIKR